MKIGLYAQHAGLIDLLNEIWQGIGEVRLSPCWDGFPGKSWQGDEDIIVSTLPYDGGSILSGKPTIVYYTDPTWPPIQKEVQQLFNEHKIKVIGAEDCYIPKHFIDGVKEFIPFAINPNRYPKYVGTNPEIIIINRKAHKRWDEVIRGATGVGMSLDYYLDGLPWRWVQEEDPTKFRNEYARNRVLFYFSHSPYTIVLFEAMTAGIPIVAFNYNHVSKSNPVEHYLNAGKCFYSTDRDDIRKYLSLFLKEASEPVIYPNLPDFYDVREQWRVLFERTIHEHSIC